MEEVNINLIQLLKLDLNVNEYLTLVKLKLMGEGQSFAFSSTEKHLTTLVDKGYLEVDGESLKFSAKGLKIFKQAGVTISEKDFEKFYTTYPMKTPSGRRLRSSIAVGSNKMTRDFESCYKKYRSKVKDLSEHEDVIKATKVMLYDYKRRGAMEYMQNLETYINQRTWEKYIDIDPLELISENVEKL